mmetsp:Transcript_10591/g.19533  ORF Transcript_10591/g.19533 Transcript_10591/m.19533 type:complete len:220 (+) Transcript_10591:681-1340(+)
MCSDRHIEPGSSIRDGRTTLQAQDLAVARADEDRGSLQLLAHALHELRRGEVLVLRLDLQPRHHMSIVCVVFVPVGSSPSLSHFVHSRSANLNLQRLRLVDQNSCVQGLVTIWFGFRNIVLHSFRTGCPAGMNLAQDLIAKKSFVIKCQKLRFNVKHHTQRQDVLDLLNAAVASLHLSPSAVHRFFAIGNVNCCIAALVRVPHKKHFLQLLGGLMDRIA